MKKKKWTTPMLVVLVRGRPEEMVLSACKWGPPDGAGARDNTCTRYLAVERVCEVECSTVAVS